MLGGLSISTQSIKGGAGGLNTSLIGDTKWTCQLSIQVAVGFDATRLLPEDNEAKLARTRFSAGSLVLAERLLPPPKGLPQHKTHAKP